MSTSKTYQQSLANAGSEIRPPMLESGPYQFQMFVPTGSTLPTLQTAWDLQGDELLHYDAGIELMNLILLSITNEIYNSDEAGVILIDEQNDFLFADASRMEEIEELSANICLMARIQPANNTSDAGPSYDFTFISEVQSSSINENKEQMYLTHTKIINSTIGDDQIDINIIFDEPNGYVNSGSVEKDTHVPDLYALEQLARNAYLEAEKQQLFAQKVQQQNTTLTNQLELYKERVRVLENINRDNNYLNEFLEADRKAKHFNQQAQSQFIRDRDIIRDLEKQRDKLDLAVNDYKRKNEELQKTHLILKRQMSENEDRYHDNILDLEAKLKKNVDLMLKLGNSLQGMFMLGPKPLSVYDPQLKHGLGYSNPYTLKQAISQCPKLYLASSLSNSEIPLNVRDTEDTLDDASKSQQKMKEKMNDPIAVANKQNCWTIDYQQINALYKDFVPQKELSAEQKYFPSSFIPSDKTPNATSSIPASMPSDYENDGFIEVKRKKNKSKQPRQVDGIRITKPSLNLHYKRVKKGESSKFQQPANTKKIYVPVGEKVTNETSSSDETNSYPKVVPPKRPEGVVLKNLFASLPDEDASVWAARKHGIMLSEFLRLLTKVIGMNLSPKQSEIRQVIQENNLSVYAILESHVVSSKLDRLCTNVFRHWSWTSNGALCSKGTRIILGWNANNVDVNIIAQDDQWRALWEKLGMHKVYVRNRPWCMLGDFNAALNLEDMSLGIKPKGSDGVLKKIDRVMANLEFNDVFVGSYAVFKPYRIYDHALCVLKIPLLTNTASRPFKFANCLFIMIGSRMLSIEDGFISLWLELDRVQKDLDADLTNVILREEEAAYVQAFNNALLMQERLLMQKAKIKWLKVERINGENIMKSIKKDLFIGFASEVIARRNEGAVPQGQYWLEVLNDPFRKAKKSNMWCMIMRTDHDGKGSSSTEILIESLSSHLPSTQSYKSLLPQTNNNLELRTNARNKMMVLDGESCSSDVVEDSLLPNKETFQRNIGKRRNGKVGPKRLQDSDYFKDKMLTIDSQRVEQYWIENSSCFSTGEKDHLDEYHEVKRCKNDEQHNFVVTADADYTSDSNIILYDHKCEAKSLVSLVDYVKPKVLAPRHKKRFREIVEEARVVKPLDNSLHYACQYTKLSQELLECVIGTCPKSFNERDNKAPSTPVTRKKKVTFSDNTGTFYLSNQETQNAPESSKALIIPVITLRTGAILSCFPVLDVAFRSITAFVRDNKGTDILKGSSWPQFVHDID
ncbi:retrovirus-related pol polyprotein from transposon TNT 1-94 [Tanacetum coccineum]